jgi:hypothetical protein
MVKELKHLVIMDVWIDEGQERRKKEELKQFRS